MLEALKLWVETHSLLLTGLAALLTMAVIVVRLVGGRIRERCAWWWFLFTSLFMNRRDHRILVECLKQIALLPFDKHSRIIGDYIANLTIANDGSVIRPKQLF